MPTITEILVLLIQPGGFGISVKFPTCIQGVHYSVQISAATPAIAIEISSHFSQSPQANSKIVPRLDHDPFLQNPLQLIILQSTYRSTPQTLVTESTEKYKTCIRLFVNFSLMAEGTQRDPVS
jgi:hypothetical protein